MIKTVFIGSGLIAGTHARAIKEIAGIRIAGFCDIDTDRAKTLAGANGAAHFEDFKAAIDQCPCDYVSLLTPRSIRRPVIEYCIQKNIPVFLEKPPCHNMAAGRVISKALAKSGLLNSVGFVNRYSGALNHVLAKIDRDKICVLTCTFSGPMAITPVIDSYPGAYLNEASGGIIGDQAIHYIDLARYISGAEVRRFEVMGNSFLLKRSRKVTTYDNAAIILEMSNTLLVTLHHNWSTRTWQAMMNIKTDDSNLVIDFYRDSACGTLKGKDFKWQGENVKEYFRQEHLMFAKALKTGDRTYIKSPFDDALESFRISEKINRRLYS